MTRTQIIKRYNKLVEEIENMEIYDGRNTVDQYQCGKCHFRVFTTYKDKGVTPFVIGCPICGDSMHHNRTFSKDTFTEGVRVLKWYRPELKHLLKMNEPEIDHVLNGGLILEKSIPRLQLSTENEEKVV